MFIFRTWPRACSYLNIFVIVTSDSLRITKWLEFNICHFFLGSCLVPCVTFHGIWIPQKYSLYWLYHCTAVCIAVLVDLVIINSEMVRMTVITFIYSIKEAPLKFFYIPILWWYELKKTDVWITFLQLFFLAYSTHILIVRPMVNIIISIFQTNIPSFDACSTFFSSCKLLKSS